MVGAAFGAAGQRCMALSTAVMVGEAGEWVHDIAERAAKLKVRQILLFILLIHTQLRIQTTSTPESYNQILDPPSYRCPQVTRPQLMCPR